MAVAASIFAPPAYPTHRRKAIAAGTYGPYLLPLALMMPPLINIIFARPISSFMPKYSDEAGIWPISAFICGAWDARVNEPFIQRVIAVKHERQKPPPAVSEIITKR